MATADVKAVDNNLAKLAAKGLSVLVSSGDSGSGYVPPRKRACGSVVDNSCCYALSLLDNPVMPQHHCHTLISLSSLLVCDPKQPGQSGVEITAGDLIGTENADVQECCQFGQMNGARGQACGVALILAPSLISLHLHRLDMVSTQD